MTGASLPGVPARPTRARYLVLAGLCGLAFLAYLDRVSIMRVQEDIVRDLKLDATEATGAAPDATDSARLASQRANERLALMFSAFLWGYLIFEVPGGFLGDLFGPRRGLAAMVAAWSLFTALTGSVGVMAGWLSTRPGPALSLGVLMAMRFLFGLAQAGAYPNIARALGRWFPLTGRAGAQGAVWMSSRLGGALAPIIAGWLLLGPGRGDWRWVFWILGSGGMAAAGLFFLWFRDRPEDVRGVNEAERALIRGAAAGRGSIYDDSEPPPLPLRRLLLSKNLLAIYLTAAAVSFSWWFCVTFLPKYLKDEFQVDYGKSELMSGLPLLAGAAGCLAGGRLSDLLVRATGSRRWGRSLPGAVGFTLAAASTLSIPFLHGPRQAITAICLASALQDLAIPCLWSLPADVGGRYAGTVGGCMNTVGAIGGMLSPLVAARLANDYGWNRVFLAFGAAYVLGALLWLRIDASEQVLPAAGGPPSPAPAEASATRSS